MDRISGLPDELLVKILSFAPRKVALSTRILSKRWEFLWLWLPKLKYDSRDPGRRNFIDKYLPLHRAPVIESLNLYFNCYTKPQVVRRWVGIAVSRYVRELKIIDFSEKCGNIFPNSFYTSKSLVILKLEQVTLEGVPSMACLHSLKTLKLLYVDADDQSLQEFLSICPVLEELFVQFRRGDEEDVKKFTIAVPSLQRLSLFISDEWVLDGYEIDTPSLKYFKLVDWNEEEHYSKIKNMPKLVEANVDAQFEILESVIGSITSVKRLRIFSETLDTGGGFVFNQLENLKLKYSGSRIPFDDDDALTIAKSMPELRHLRLVRNTLTDTGLNAILDKCTHLEHLDLCKCSNINLSGDLQKRCLERVKEFRHAKDSTNDTDSEDSEDDNSIDSDDDNSIDSDE